MSYDLNIYDYFILKDQDEKLVRFNCTNDASLALV